MEEDSSSEEEDDEEMVEQNVEDPKFAKVQPRVDQCEKLCKMYSARVVNKLAAVLLFV